MATGGWGSRVRAAQLPQDPQSLALKVIYSGSVGARLRGQAWASCCRKLDAARSDVGLNAAGAPRKTADIHWVKPILVANVEIAEWTNSGKLRQAG